MNSTQIQSIKNGVTRFFNIDVEEFILLQYPSPAGGQKIVGEYSSQDLIYLSNKLMNNFRVALDSPDFIAFPAQYQLNNEYGGGELVADITGFVSCFESNRGAKILAFLHRLIGYQLQNGIWRLGENEPIKNLTSDVERAQSALKTTEKKIDISIRKINQTYEESKKILAEITGVRESLVGMANQLQSYVESSRKAVGLINEEGVNAARVSEKLNSTLDLSIEKKNEIDRTAKSSLDSIDQAKKLLENFKIQASSLVEEFSGKNDRFSEVLNIVENDFSKFKDRNEYLDDLIGREVGASLFETFKQRKMELNVGVWVWRISVPIAAALTAYWIYFLFSNIDLSSLKVATILLNSIKTIPVVAFLFFSISQYTKERNFQEEYAFKSAVALTVNSYANQLTSNDSKDKLILTSVSAIYKSPISSRHRDQKSGRTLKDAIEAIKALRGEKPVA